MDEDNRDAEPLRAELRAESERLRARYRQRKPRWKNAKMSYQRVEIVRPGDRPIVIERGNPAPLFRLRRLLGHDWPGRRQD